MLQVIKNAKSDAEIETYCKTFVARKAPGEVERWNDEWLTHKPEGPSLEYFLKLRNQVAPDRTDVTNWADLLDLDEKRRFRGADRERLTTFAPSWNTTARTFADCNISRRCEPW